jgi:hypothetical protein
MSLFCRVRSQSNWITRNLVDAVSSRFDLELDRQKRFDDANVGGDVVIRVDGGEAAAAGEGHGEQELVGEVEVDGGIGCEKTVHHARGAVADFFGGNSHFAESTGHCAGIRESALDEAGHTLTGTVWELVDAGVLAGHDLEGGLEHAFGDVRGKVAEGNADAGGLVVSPIGEIEGSEAAAGRDSAGDLATAGGSESMLSELGRRMESHALQRGLVDTFEKIEGRGERIVGSSAEMKGARFVRHGEGGQQGLQEQAGAARCADSEAIVSGFDCSGVEDEFG